MSDVDARTARRRKLITGGLIVVFAAVLIAIVVVRSGAEKVLNANGETLVLVGEKADGGMDALGSGKLADVGGCLGWAPTGSDEGTVVIWPHGTNVETPDPLRVKIAGKFYAIGDTVEIGGGHTGPLEPSDYFYNQVPKSCRTADVFVANEG